MIGRLLRAAWRFHAHHPLQLALAVAGVALGVAVFVGVVLANDSARRAFEQSESLLVGRATHQLVGIGGEIPNRLYRELRIEHGPLAAAPVIEAEARLAGDTVGRALLGVDPLEERAFRPYAGSGSAALAAGSNALLAEPGSVLVPQHLSTELGLGIGDRLELTVDHGLPATVTVVGTLDGESPAADGANLPLVADVATVQDLRDRDTLTRIDLVLTPQQAAALRELHLPGVALVPAPSRSRVFDELSRAFRINLTALSLLALLVGAFLIYATMSFAVLRRRHVFGTYRALGVPRHQLLLSVLIEALALGLVATAAGIVLGRVLSASLVELVLRTIGDLYFSTAVRPVPPSPMLYVEGVAVGVGTSLAAAALPALEATRVPPRVAMSRAALERAARRISRRGVLLAAPCAALGALTLAAAPRSLSAAFAGLFLVIVAAALVIPASAAAVLRLVEPAAGRVFGVPGALAARGVTAALSRTGVATAALTVAVGTVIGVGLMIASFRGSVEQWLQATLLADYYAEADDWELPAGPPLGDATLSRIVALPAVRGLSLLQFTRLPTPSGDINLRAILPGPDGWGLTVTDAVAADALERMAAGEGVFVSEALAYRRRLAAGAALTLPTRDGPRDFPVLGVYREYNTDGGGVLMPMTVYRRHWDDRRLDGIGFYLDPAADRGAAAAALRGALAGRPGTRLQSTEAIRERSLDVFDRTFRITEVLRVLAGAVAFLGLLSALLAIELDRGKEIAVLRALGFSPRQIGTLSMTQTTLLGLAAGVLAIPLGVVMAGLLVGVINRRSFGWGMDLALRAEPLALGFALAVAAAVLAGAYPALRLSRSSVVARLREE